MHKMIKKIFVTIFLTVFLAGCSLLTRGEFVKGYSLEDYRTDMTAYHNQSMGEDVIAMMNLRTFPPSWTCVDYAEYVSDTLDTYENVVHRKAQGYLDCPEIKEKYPHKLVKGHEWNVQILEDGTEIRLDASISVSDEITRSTYVIGCTIFPLLVRTSCIVPESLLLE